MFNVELKSLALLSFPDYHLGSIVFNSINGWAATGITHPFVTNLPLILSCMLRKHAVEVPVKLMCSCVDAKLQFGDALEILDLEGFTNHRLETTVCAILQLLLTTGGFWLQSSGALQAQAWVCLLCGHSVPLGTGRELQVSALPWTIQQCGLLPLILMALSLPGTQLYSMALESWEEGIIDQDWIEFW